MRGLRRIVVLIQLTLLVSVGGAQQRPTVDPESFRPAVGSLTIRVRDVNGGPLPGQAIIRLTSIVGTIYLTGATQENAQAVFRSLPLGEYRVEVTAPGYQETESEVEVSLRDSMSTVIIELRPEGIAKPVPVSSGPPLLAPKARRELEKGLESLRANNLKEAQARLERAHKLAPNHPDVHYLLGLLFIKQDDANRARTHLEKATSLMPSHVFAQSTLGILLANLGENEPAIRALEQAMAAGSRTWETPWTLANMYFRVKQYEKARAHAERALEMARGKAPAADLLVARALAAEQKMEAALKRLRNFLLHYPNGPLAAEARQLEASLTAPPDGKKSGSTADSGPPPAPRLEVRVPERNWAPPDVDETAPPVAPDVACSLPTVLAEAGQRVKSLVENLQQFTASEVIEHSEVDAAGFVRSFQSKAFDYLVEIREIRPGILSVEESRGPSIGPVGFPTRFLSTGLAAMAFIFHPYYVEDFETRCEGLGRWEGEPVWQIYFRQRADRPIRMRSYRTAAGRFPIALKGRAWISAAHYQVLHLEAALIEPVQPLQLERDHLIVDYAPVEFKQRQTRLWLPRRSELYIQMRGRRYVHRHNFTDFMLFSVDVGQKIKPPPEP